MFCLSFAEISKQIAKIVKQAGPEAPKGSQILEKLVTTASNPPAGLRAGATGKGREGKGINPLPRDWEGKDL